MRGTRIKRGDKRPILRPNILAIATLNEVNYVILRSIKGTLNVGKRRSLMESFFILAL